MSDVVKHWFVSPKPDGADPTEIQPSGWNHEHIFSGGAQGHLLFRDTGASDGAGWTIGPHADLTFSGDWLVINRTENSPTTSVGISFGEKGATVWAVGLDYQSSEMCLWLPSPGDVWRIAPNGQMTMGGGVGTPSVEVCHFIMRGLQSLDYIIGWRWGAYDRAWMDKYGRLTIPYLAAASGTRYLVIDTAGLITSSASAPSGT